MFYPNSKLFDSSPTNDPYNVKKCFTLIVDCLTTLLLMTPIMLRNALPNSGLFDNSPTNDPYNVKKCFTLIVDCLTTLLLMTPIMLRNALP